MGLLIGFAAIGHAVWIFEGSAAALAEGCREADLMIVDGTRLEGLPANWQSLAMPAMRNPQIWVYDRATHQLRRAGRP